MSKATAGDEIPRLAAKCGFDTVHVAGNSWAFFHEERAEGLSLRCSDSGEFLFARWHAPIEYVTIVDKRAPGEYGKEGRSLTGNAKRRPVGVDDVHPELVASPEGLDVGYLEAKRRLRNADWRES